MNIKNRTDYEKISKCEMDILSVLSQELFINQRILSEMTGYSLGMINRSLKNLMELGYITEDMKLSMVAIEMLKQRSPQRAVILAAGFGMRMIPINFETPKAMLEIRGEKIIEHQIKQLQEVGINEIYIVVGFMKEQFEYLIDEYGVELLTNVDYAKKNNMYSLKLAFEYLEKHNKLENTYIIPCDLWCEKNVFQQNEMYSWYMVSNLVDEDSEVRINRKMELVRTRKSAGNAMVGICYLLKEDMEFVKERIDCLSKDTRNDAFFWEEALYYNDRMIVQAKVVQAFDVIEINTYEQLRDFDKNSQQLKSDAISIIAQELNVKGEDIADITSLKKGMTNRSFVFTCKGKKYIMRIPGEGTEQLINRTEEAEVYHAIEGKGICDDPIYLNEDNGYKITEYLENVRVCNPIDQNDLKKCMKKLREFHDMKLKVNHEFDIFKQIEFYERLWNGKQSVYKSYQVTKHNIFSLKSYIQKYEREKVLTHIDANHDNFLFYRKGNEEALQLTDWEYAGMQDPDVDIAMFGIYALFDKEQIDELISIYYENNCPIEIRTKIYCYVAACGLLWSNWCEYKSTLGVEFGDYNLRQYRYAKDYYKIAMEEIKKQER